MRNRSPPLGGEGQTDTTAHRQDLSMDHSSQTDGFFFSDTSITPANSCDAEELTLKQL